MLHSGWRKWGGRLRLAASCAEAGLAEWVGRTPLAAPLRSAALVLLAAGGDTIARLPAPAAATAPSEDGDEPGRSAPSHQQARAPALPRARLAECAAASVAMHVWVGAAAGASLASSVLASLWLSNVFAVAGAHVGARAAMRRRSRARRIVAG
ncbi:hypothetical protein EMIHUDRAFT_244828 [Emiliania huxleyi CCMP1516]|uniref:Copper transporter n=2 Tax=Emiliania huxleyi TaxID=2903 RepID=A0A0D3IZF7_EMIH1|nr:hypothetical protein EMIHUDRAFT_244828 [Emiliania huxleyi CCMP1516]EOD16642.1 hypothetical protein EMIHUDRAFT_244828 [Emiliania huxleyi CCMP1516]|eukprot:XP_005769071.1 hypothetical protein EMIHUDRAFT_244828 [Emiliania huxleyi CCMP1516]